MWCGKVNDCGYGLVSVQGRRRLAHRVAWELEHGPIPYGRTLRHTCGEPACVRSDHLVLDRLYRKLTVIQVVAIRSDSGSLSRIARKYAISKQHVHDIKSGRKRTSDIGGYADAAVSR